MQLPQGFQFSGLPCGIKRSGKPDLALIVGTGQLVAAGVYTQNVVRASSIDWNRSITPTDRLRAIVVNSGNANACTGQQGEQDNAAMAQRVGQCLQCDPEQVAVLSTGVIGQHLPMDKVNNGIDQAASSLGNQEAHFLQAATAITTTDHNIKVADGQLQIEGQDVCIAGMAKGAGMIGPNMATLLSVVCLDVQLAKQQAQQLVQDAANASFNRISVEGHMSTNDALLLVSSGAVEISWEGSAGEQNWKALRSAVESVCLDMAKKIPGDGEGATHLVEIEVSGAVSDRDADRVARTIAASNLVKTAIAGGDPNWGRIVSAAGYSGAEIDIAKTQLQINGHIVFDQGQPVAFDATTVSLAMKDQFETKLVLRIGDGSGQAQHWTSDLTVEYVRFNSEYTT